MINTVQIKEQQLKNGFFSIGTGPEVILVMGSCRVVNYVSYLAALNIDNRFTIYSLDPFNWNWDAKDNRVDYRAALLMLQYDEKMLTMLKSVKIFIHEYYANAGMFNCDKKGLTKTIYDYGMNPEIDVCIPNFNDYFILFPDIITFDTELRNMAMQDYNVLGKLAEQTQQLIL